MNFNVFETVKTINTTNDKTINFCKYSDNKSLFKSNFFSKNFKSKNLKEILNDNSENKIKMNKESDCSNSLNGNKEKNENLNLKPYTYKNTPLTNSSIRVQTNIEKTDPIDRICKKNSFNSLDFKSKFLRQSQENPSFQNFVNYNIITTKYKIKQVDDIIYRPQTEENDNNLSYTSEIDEELIDNILLFKNSNKHSKNYQCKIKINSLTDKRKATTTKIEEIDFNPHELIKDYRTVKQLSLKKDRTYYEILNERRRQTVFDEEIEFSISDITVEDQTNIATIDSHRTSKDSNSKANKPLSHKKYQEENEKKNKNDYFDDRSVRKSLQFSEKLVFDTEEIINTNTFEVGTSTLNLLYRSENAQKDKDSHVKNNSEFSLQSNTSTSIIFNNSQRTKPKKRVSFTDDTSVYSFDNSKIIPKTRNSLKRKNKNFKIKPILIRRDSYDYGVTSNNEFNKPTALDKLNKLIKECELEEKTN